MWRLIFCTLFSSFILPGCRTPLQVYKRIGSGKYMSTVHNIETNLIDTIYTDLNPDGTFIISRTGDRLKVIFVGEWQQSGKWLIMTNRYPDDRFVSVRVDSYKGSCNGYLPDLIDSSGKVAEGFCLKVNEMPYYIGDKISYEELDTSRKVRVCSIGNYFCSDWLTIPYKDCYRIVINMSVDPVEYNGMLKKMYFLKRGNKLELLKSDISDRPSFH